MTTFEDNTQRGEEGTASSHQVPAADVQAAEKKGCEFSIFRKERRGARWVEVSRISNLREAVAAAKNVEAYEAAVFLGGIFYWSTRFPEVFNSTIFDLVCE